MQDLIILTIVNILVWTGLFLFLLFTLMRGNKAIGERLEKMEQRHKTDQPK